MDKQSELLQITEKNRLAWDASALHHRSNPGWERLKASFTNPRFSTFDDTMTSVLDALPIKGQSVVQIGCNNGRELLSAMSLGASTGLGIDQSREFLQQARELTEIAGKDCQYVGSNIYELPSDIADKFDVAMITIGVLNWMPDLPLFFATVSSLLKKSGKLVIYETHPILEVFEPKSANPFLPANSYFSKLPNVSEQAIVYDESEASTGAASYWFIHGFGEIINACIQAGLCIDQVIEYPHSNRETEYDVYKDQKAQLPMCFTLIAHKT